MFAESLNEVLARCLLKVSSRLDESLFMDWLPWLLIPSPLKYKGNTKKNTGSSPPPPAPPEVAQPRGRGDSYLHVFGKGVFRAPVTFPLSALG